MKAVIRNKYGPPEILSIQEVNIPTPKENELLIRVYSTTVNRTDCGVLWGKPFVFRFFTGLWKPRHASTGTDFAGVVEAIGKNVTQFKVGERVFGFNDHGCGSHAQYITIAANNNIITIPDTISFDEAAAAPEGAHYAWNYIRKTKMKTGDKVLVYGATGAIGSAAVQLLKHIGAHVTAVCNTKNVALIQSLAPDRVFDYETEDFTNGGEQYHFILDAVGKSNFGICKKILKPGGLYMSSELGPGNENLYLPLTTRWSKKRMVFPVPTDIKATLKLVKELLDNGKFKPIIDRHYPMEKIAEAFTYVNSGQKTGSVILNL